MSPHSFLAAAARKIDELAARACPSAARPGLLVALSGGPDSVALLLAAHHWAAAGGNALAAAHLDHRLRGKDSAGDAAFCRDLCASLGIPLHLAEQDPRPVARRRGLGLEEAGRSLRETFFSSLLERNPGLHCVATGHHMDDQAETVIMRLFRGTGPDGLVGIRPVSGHTIHPLLDFTRREILAFLEERKQPWRTDATNLAGDNLRSRLRRELLPLVRDIFGTGCDLTPARLGKLLTCDQEYLAELARRKTVEVAEDRDGNKGLRVSGLLALPEALALRVIRNWLADACGADLRRVEADHVMNILTWLREGQSGTGLDLPDGLRVVRDFDLLLAASPPGASVSRRSAADYRILVKREDNVTDPPALGLAQGAGTADQAGNWNLSCPADAISGNLRLRNPRPGDRFRPFGLDGTRKLSDLFRELRIPEDRRRDLLLVEDETAILWIVGVARSEKTRLLPSSDRIVTICVARR